MMANLVATAWTATRASMAPTAEPEQIEMLAAMVEMALMFVEALEVATAWTAARAAMASTPEPEPMAMLASAVELALMGTLLPMAEPE